MPFAFEDHGIDQLYDAPNANSSFNAQEVDDNALLHSATSGL